MNDDDPKAIVADVIGDVQHLSAAVTEQQVPPPASAILITGLFIVKQKLTALQEILSGGKP